MTLPNILTLSRIFFAGLIVWLLLQYSLGAYIAAAILFTAAALTDFYDGYLAKKQGLTSDFGKIMDPIADKVLMLSIFGVLARMGMVGVWMVAAIAAREILVTVSRLYAMTKGKVLAAEQAGKIKTVFQIVTISIVLLFLIAEESPCTTGWFFQAQPIWQGIINFLMMVTMFLTVGSGALYFRNQWTALQRS